MKQVLLCFALLFCSLACFSQSFQKGNIVICRYGTSNKPVSNNAISVFLDEYDPSGKLVRSLPMPTAANGKHRKFTGLESNFYEGLLSLSGNGKYITLAGYDAAEGATVLGTTADVVNRVIALVSADGNINTTTAISTNVGNIRNVVTDDGSAFWIVGGTPGIFYAPANGEISKIINTGARSATIVNQQLYLSATAGVRIGSAGATLPVAPIKSVKSLPRYPDTEGFPNQFILLDSDKNGAPDLLYVADNGANPKEAKIIKYVFNGTGWDVKGTLSIPGVTDGLKAITASVSGKNVSIYGLTYSKTPASTVFRVSDLTDAELNNKCVLTSIVTAAKNTSFKGIAMAPVL